MPRIDANLATQLADLPQARPAQSNLDRDRAAQQIVQAKAEIGDSPPAHADDLHTTARRVRQVVEAAAGKQIDYGLRIDDKTKDVVVRFTDQESGKVIKEIPSKEMRQLGDRIDAIVGMLFDQQA